MGKREKIAIFGYFFRVAIATARGARCQFGVYIALVVLNELYFVLTL